MNIPFDAYAYSNRLRHLPSAQKLSFAIGVLVISLIVHSTVHLMILGWLCLWTVRYAGVPFRLYLKLLALPAGFMLFSLPALCIGVVPAERMDEAWPDALAFFSLHSWVIYLSKAGCLQALTLLVRALAATSSLYFLLLTVPVGELLRVLRNLGLPPVLLELLLVMYRFVFVLSDVVRQVWIAQQARGGYRGMAASLRDAARLVVQLFVRTWQRYRQLTIGLLARGFSGELRVVSAPDSHRSSRYIAEAIGGCLLLLGLEWWTRS
ncbi:MAG: cobalt ECF transporter T component CbiQ [Brevibacillus sp.]|nr:cobalt ECF transporter T component CbiQ [Brevibacillus sp.]